MTIAGACLKHEDSGEGSHNKAARVIIDELEKNGYTITKKVDDRSDEMYLNMQYYMEYCESKEYVTPKDWIEKHKHFK